MFTLVFVTIVRMSHKPSADEVSRFMAGQSNVLVAVMLVLVVLVIPIAIAWFRALWNNVMPRVADWREITSWEAAGLLALATLLLD